MNPARESWTAFLDYLEHAMPEFDGLVPVALLLAPVEPEGDSLKLSDATLPVIVWSEDVPVEWRQLLLTSFAMGSGPPEAHVHATPICWPCELKDRAAWDDPIVLEATYQTVAVPAMSRAQFLESYLGMSPALRGLFSAGVIEHLAE